jgi:hypothetical protein
VDRELAQPGRGLVGDVAEGPVARVGGLLHLFQRAGDARGILGDNYPIRDGTQQGSAGDEVVENGPKGPARSAGLSSAFWVASCISHRSSVSGVHAGRDWSVVSR